MGSIARHALHRLVARRHCGTVNRQGSREQPTGKDAPMTASLTRRDAMLAAGFGGVLLPANLSAQPAQRPAEVRIGVTTFLSGPASVFGVPSRRAAEMLFRPQRLTLKDGVMLLADEELVDGTNVNDHTSPLVAIFGDAKARDLDILTPEVAPQYWSRSDGFDLVLDFRHGEPARTAFARVLETWVQHLVGTVVTIEPLERVEDREWSWFVGLDQDATRIGNALWRGEEPPEDGRQRIVALFRLAFRDPADMLERVAGRPVYLILSATGSRIVRVKPQNLIAGLPLKAAGAVN